MANSKFNQAANPSVDCDPAIVAGDWLYMDGSAVAQKAQADGLVKSGVIGVCVEKVSASVAKIATPGQIADVFSGLDETKDYFLSAATPGGMVTNTSLPTTAGHVILNLGRPVSPTAFLVELGPRIVLS